MFQSILFPFDGTSRCMAAVPQLIALVKLCRAQLTVLHVDRGSAFDILTFQDLRTEITRALYADGDALEPVFHLAEGEAGEEIIRYSKNHGMNLIAISGRRPSWMRRLFGRSVTERLLRNAPCPVWLIGEDDRSTLRIDKIVCGITDTRGAAATARVAKRFADSLDAELTLAYAVPELNESTLARMSQDPPFLSVAAAKRYLYALAQSVWMNPNCEAEVGGEDRVFASMVKRLGADILMIDRGRNGLAIDVPKLARRAGCPVLVTNGALAEVRSGATAFERDLHLVSKR